MHGLGPPWGVFVRRLRKYSVGPSKIPRSQSARAKQTPLCLLFRSKIQVEHIGAMCHVPEVFAPLPFSLPFGPYQLQRRSLRVTAHSGSVGFRAAGSQHRNANNMADANDSGNIANNSENTRYNLFSKIKTRTQLFSCKSTIYRDCWQHKARRK